jgi:hypothetical protein
MLIKLTNKTTINSVNNKLRKILNSRSKLTRIIQQIVPEVPCVSCIYVFSSCQKISSDQITRLDLKTKQSNPTHSETHYFGRYSFNNTCTKYISIYSTHIKVSTNEQIKIK